MVLGQLNCRGQLVVRKVCTMWCPVALHPLRSGQHRKSNQSSISNELPCALPIIAYVLIINSTGGTAKGKGRVRHLRDTERKGESPPPPMKTVEQRVLQTARKKLQHSSHRMSVPHRVWFFLFLSGVQTRSPG